MRTFVAVGTWISLASFAVAIFIGRYSPIVSWQTLFVFGGAIVVGIVTHAQQSAGEP